MNRLEALRKIKTKHELAALLGVKASTLTYVLYVLKPSTQYTTFTIPKKTGGMRTILAPLDRLKGLQSALSELLQDCITEINKTKETRRKDGKFKSTLSHGFVRERSIITNAMMHLNQKNVLNVDLKNFFDSFNFGRVRGFFIANNHFQLDPHIATVIAQIACYDNKLPQGSPCSPVITNLITHSLDIRLASLAKNNSCTYSRYADDITLSTREVDFPRKIMRESNGEYIAGKKFKSEIERAGFELNNKKSRIQYKDSRQEVTGLVVNKKPNVKNEYWRTVRSQCHSLFNTGTFTKEVNKAVVVGNINELEGKLNFIDQVDRHNRSRQKPPLNPVYELAKHGHATKKLLNGREKTFSRFLYYRLFYGNIKPTILCEGKTDNVYLKSAISMLAANYPKLAKQKSATEPYELLIRFLEYSKRTRFLLELYGGTSYLREFIGAFDKHYNFYKAPTPTNPVIIIVDNDSGFNAIDARLKNIDSAQAYPTTLSKQDFRKSEFVHVIHNLYVVIVPLSAGATEAAIEDLFDVSTLSKKVSGKSFNPKNENDNATQYGKEVFASKVVKAEKNSINFDGFRPLLESIVKCMNHYDSIK
jgi:retron-type reverse transcriptase